MHHTLDLPEAAWPRFPALGKTVLLMTTVMVAACSPTDRKTMITIADARVHKAQMVDIGEPGDSQGDLFVFDQPLLDAYGNDIGNNSGICIRTRVGHSLQCQWTLTMSNGSIQVAGREFDKGASDIAITGGTGAYAGISGHMESVNNEDGTFTQTLYYQIP
jgi:hypothetical protein